jgi:hypothetical protein
MPVRLLAQDREILAKSTPVHLARDSLMHAIICSTRCQTPALFREQVVAIDRNRPGGSGQPPYQWITSMDMVVGCRASSGNDWITSHIS